MPYFPFFSDISDKQVLIIGGGKRALFKVERLLPFSPKIRVIYPEVKEEICKLSHVSVEKRCPRKEDFSPELLFVVAASEDAEENRKVAELCRSKHIPVNAVDYPEYCDFIFPSLITRGSLSIGISTGGACPAVTSQLKENIEDLLPEITEELLLWLENLTPALRRSIAEDRERGRAIRELFSEGIRSGRVLTAEETDNILQKYK